MKKILLSAVALVAAMSVNAQVFQMDGEAQGLTSDLSNVDANKAWGAIDGALDIYNAFDTQHKIVDCKNNDYIKVLIDGNEILTKGGIQGNDNPKDADGTGVGISLKEPAGGAVIGLTAKKNGWVYIVAKISSNKQYIVFEEGTPIGYKIAMESADERAKNGVINVVFEGEGEFNELTLDKYPGGLPWVIRQYMGDAEAATAGNGLGVFYFPVYADCKYLASASGSKISWSGIYFAESEAANVKVAKEDGTELVLIGSSSTGISTVKAAVENNSATIYNVAGQQVSKNYKGLVIKNGKKFVNK